MKRSTVQQVGFGFLWIYTKFSAGVCPCKGEMSLAITLDSDQLDTHLLYFTIRPLQSSTCFEYYMIIRRLNCIDAASDIFTLSKLPSGAQVEREVSQPMHRAATY